MNERAFRMHLGCRYERPDNRVADLEVQHMVKGKWQPFNLDFSQPGFVIFVYAILNCQHLYMRTNAAERGLLLESAEGVIEVGASEDWVVQRLDVAFEARLHAGVASAQDTDYIIDRMRHCPVSVNLRAVPESDTRVEFVGTGSG